MNAETLHAVDTLYLQVFQQNVLGEVRRALISLKQHHQQSEILAKAKELPPTFQHNYMGIAERLLPLINMLGGTLRDLESGGLSWQAAAHIEATSPEETKRIIDQLDTAEQEILDVLGKVGGCLAALPRSIIAWHDCGFFRVHVLLKKLPARPCYDLEVPIDFHTHPFFIADYFASKKQGERQHGQWPHYLN